MPCPISSDTSILKCPETNTTKLKIKRELEPSKLDSLIFISDSVKFSDSYFIDQPKISTMEVCTLMFLFTF